MTSASFASSVVNMLKTAIGSGVLALPFALKTLGYLPFAVILLGAAGVAFYSVYILLLACENFNDQGRPTYSYEQVSRLAFKQRFGWDYFGARIAGFFIWMQVFGAVCTYNYLLKSQLPELLKFILSRFNVCLDNDSWFLSGEFILALLVLFVIFPLTCKTLDFLKYSSSIGLAAYSFTVMIIISFKFIISCVDLVSPSSNNGDDGELLQAVNQTGCTGYKPSNKTLQDWMDLESQITTLRNSNDTSSSDICQAQMFVPVTSESASDFFKAIAAVFFAYNLHDTLLAIYENLRNRSKNLMMKVSATAFAIIITIYALTAYFGYFTWYGVTVSDVLLMYSVTSPDSWAIFFARLFVLTSVMFSIPLVTFAARLAFYRTIFPERISGGYQIGKLDSETEAGSDDLSKDAVAPAIDAEVSPIQKYGYNIVFLGVVYVIVSFLADSIGQIIAVGGLISIHLYVVLPPIVWILTFWEEINGFDKILKNTTGLLNLLMCVFMVTLGEFFVFMNLKEMFTAEETA